MVVVSFVLYNVAWLPLPPFGWYLLIAFGAGFCLAALGGIYTLYRIQHKQSILRAEREAMERALRASEEHFRLLTEHSQDTIFRCDLFPQAHLTYVSPAVVNLTGYTMEEHLASLSLAMEIVGPEDLVRIQRAIYTPEQYPEPLEFRVRRKDGRELWVEQRHVAVYDEMGVCKTVIGIMRDITEHRQIDEQLRKLSRAVEQSSVAITITDTEGYIEYVNPRFTQHSGFSLDEVRGQKPRLLQLTDYLPNSVSEIQTALRNGVEWRGELHNLTKEGKPYVESGIISPVYDNQGKVTHYLAVMEDITQQKQQAREREAILAVSSALRSANDSAEMLAIVLQEIATTFDADKAFYLFHDPATDEMVVDMIYEEGTIQSNVNVHIPPGKGISAQVFRTSQPYVSVNAIQDPHFAIPEMLGDARALACVPLIAQGETIGLFTVARQVALTNTDVRLLIALTDMAATGLQRAAYHEATKRHAANLERAVAEQTRELREANLRLQELDMLKSKFVSDVSHELRTPVTNMSLYLQLIQRKPEKQSHYLAIIQEEAERLENLVSDILNLSQLDNKPSVALAPIQLNELLAGIIATHRAQAESRQLTLELSPCPDLPVIMGDAKKLIQVTTNLVANAINYTPAGFVRVRTARLDEKNVSITVEDSGIGIYAEDQPHLFQRFYRGRRDQIADIPGTGLGLSIVKELVELHGGSIQLVSEIGRGTAFTVILPTTPKWERAVAM